MRRRIMQLERTKAGEPARWDISDDLYARFSKEDDRIDLLEKDLRRAQIARAGRVVNAFGWAWCAACGARKVMVDPTAVRPVNERVETLCEWCSQVTIFELDLLHAWQRQPEQKRLPFPLFSSDHGGRPVSPERVMRFVTEQLDAARAEARAVIEGRSDVLFITSEFTLRLSGPEDIALADRARAAERGRRA